MAWANAARAARPGSSFDFSSSAVNLCERG